MTHYNTLSNNLHFFSLTLTHQGVHQGSLSLKADTVNVERSFIPD